MWKIKHIFDGNYGCEDAPEEQTGELSLTLINEKGEERYVSVTDAWMTEKGLDEGSIWPERFLFRNIRMEEKEEVTEIEQICFPPNEACSARAMKERIEAAPSTKETIFRDEFFTDVHLYDPAGDNVMLLGLDVRPEYRRQGLAREIVRQYAEREKKKGRRRLVLTCLESKVEMYQKFGFRDLGMANSTWGGEAWHEMDYQL